MNARGTEAEAAARLFTDQKPGGGRKRRNITRRVNPTRCSMEARWSIGAARTAAAANDYAMPGVMPARPGGAPGPVRVAGLNGMAEAET